MSNFETDKLVKSLKIYLEKYKEQIYAKKFDELSNMLDEMAIIRIAKNNVSETCFERISKLFLKNSKEKLTFVLGAGVSADFGIPNWETLIYRINFSNYWENMFCGQTNCNEEGYKREKFLLDSINATEDAYKTRDYIFELFRSQNNLYEWAQYAENSFCNDIELRNRGVYVSAESLEIELDNKIYYVVQKSLYYKLSQKDKNGKDVEDYIKENNNIWGDKSLDSCTISLIYKIANKKKLDRIITYNYDDCLEYIFERNVQGLKRVDKGFNCLPIFDKEQLTLCENNKRCKIYHVHGFIPHFSSYSEAGEHYKDISHEINSPDGKKLILTEVSYDDMNDEIYKWRNSIQVETLLCYHCIFVGFSATDINFKRIVKQLSKRKPYNNEPPFTHYITVCLDDYFRAVGFGNNGNNSIEEFITALDRLIEKSVLDDSNDNKLYQQIAMILNMLNDRKCYLERYNIYPIFTTIGDLPKLLAKLADIPYKN